MIKLIKLLSFYTTRAGRFFDAPMIPPWIVSFSASDRRFVVIFCILELFSSSSVSLCGFRSLPAARFRDFGCFVDFRLDTVSCLFGRRGTISAFFKVTIYDVTNAFLDPVLRVTTFVCNCAISSFSSNGIPSFLSCGFESARNQVSEIFFFFSFFPSLSPHSLLANFFSLSNGQPHTNKQKAIPSI